jgi:hypothetical protein
MKRALIAAAAAMALAAGVPGVASATTSSWTFQSATRPPGASNVLQGISCPTTTFCVATFSHKFGGYGVVEMWNGTAWSSVTLPTTDGDIQADAVACHSASDCIVIGFDFGDSAPVAAKWNGTAWTVTALPAASIPESISCPSAASCMVVGTGGTSGFGTYQLTGTGWQTETAPVPTGFEDGDLTSVSCVSASACTAVGWYQVPSGDYQAVAESWNGSAWTIENTSAVPVAEMGAVSCTSAAHCIAVGANSGPAGTSTPAPAALLWNGSTWAAQAVSLPASAKYGFLAGISCPTADSCTAVGQYNAGAKDTSLALAEVWNGSKWATQTTAQPSSNKTLAGVSCLAARTCTAVGNPTGARPNQGPIVIESE